MRLRKAPPEPAAGPGPYNAISVSGVAKTFRIPHHKADSLKERVLHPASFRESRELEALRGVSFDVQRGEFFGIAGRNGSGKSTLLKILASIYAADAGEVRVAGAMAPFIELGVGFNPDLTARENVVLNGVMMGLLRREAESRLDAVLEMAELEEFVDLKLKNYSSGMLVRLAFSVMVQSDAEILLIDEVLAVGDAAFQQKCMDAFEGMRRRGRTIVLVTHDMSAVERFCDRAMLLSRGEVIQIGAPEAVARRYIQLNFEQQAEEEGEARGAVDASPDLRLADIWLESPAGKRLTGVEHCTGAELHAVFECRAEVRAPQFGFTVVNSDGVEAFGFAASLGGGRGAVLPGERVHVSGGFANLLTSGRYLVKCGVSGADGRGVLYVPHALDFAVSGAEGIPGMVMLAGEARAEVVEAGSSR